MTNAPPMTNDEGTNRPGPLRHWSLAGDSSLTRTGDRLQPLADFLRIRRPHRPGQLVAVLEEHQRRPQLHPERPAQRLPLAVTDLDVPDAGVVCQRRGNRRLRALAELAPARPELQHRRPRK